jgi:hypothetical protein
MFTKAIAEGAAIVGQPCWYGNIIVEVLKVHNDAEPPYHTILMPNGTDSVPCFEKLTLASAAEIAQWDAIGKQLNSHWGPSSAEIAQRGKQLRPGGAVKETPNPKAKMPKCEEAAVEEPAVEAMQVLCKHKWGCSKCHWAKRGCGLCRFWAKRGWSSYAGHRNYYVDPNGYIGRRAMHPRYVDP